MGRQHAGSERPKVPYPIRDGVLGCARENRRISVGGSLAPDLVGLAEALVDHRDAPVVPPRLADGELDDLAALECDADPLVAGPAEALVVLMAALDLVVRDEALPEEPLREDTVRADLQPGRDRHKGGEEQEDGNEKELDI